MTDLGSKNPLQLAHSGYQDTKICGTKVWGGSLDFNIQRPPFRDGLIMSVQRRKLGNTIKYQLLGVS